MPKQQLLGFTNGALVAAPPPACIAQRVSCVPWTQPTIYAKCAQKPICCDSLVPVDGKTPLSANVSAIVRQSASISDAAVAPATCKYFPWLSRVPFSISTRFSKALCASKRLCRDHRCQRDRVMIGSKKSRHGCLLRPDRTGHFSSATCLCICILYMGVLAAALLNEERSNSKEKSTEDVKFNWDSTIILGAAPEEIRLLEESLSFPQAVVSVQPDVTSPMRHIDWTMQNKLKSANIFGVKRPRLTILFIDDDPLKIDNSEPDKGATCKESQKAMLVSFKRIFRSNFNEVYATFKVHNPSAAGFYKELDMQFNLNVLNPDMWKGHVPTDVEQQNFRGTAVCVNEGDKMQLLRDWPLRVPDFKEGPWEARVKILQAYVTPSAEVKKELYLLQALLKLIRIPGKGIFVNQNLDTIPFMGYVEIKRKKFEDLDAALVRHELLDNTCELKRKQKLSQIELHCPTVDARLTDLKEMVEEQPKLRELYKRTGILTGISAASLFLAFGTHILKHFSNDVGAVDITTCIVLGAASAVAALVGFIFSLPQLVLERSRWREKFGRLKRMFVRSVVDAEKKRASSYSPVLDIVMIVNTEEMHAENPEASYPKDSDANLSLKHVESLQEEGVSEVEENLQHVVNRYFYLDCSQAALENMPPLAASHFAQRVADFRAEKQRLRAFMQKLARLRPQLLNLSSTGNLLFSVRQKLSAYNFLADQLRKELTSPKPAAETEGMDVVYEALSSKHITDQLMLTCKRLYEEIKQKGGVALPLDTTDVYHPALQRRLEQVETAAKLIEAEIAGSDEVAAKRGLQRDLELARETAELLKLELRVSIEEDLELALEESDNLKQKIHDVQKAGGKQPSIQQRAELDEAKARISELHQKIRKLFSVLRKHGLPNNLAKRKKVSLSKSV